MDFIDSLDVSHLIVAAIAFALGYVVAMTRRDSDPRSQRTVRTAADALARQHPRETRDHPPEMMEIARPEQPGAAFQLPPARNWFAIIFIAVWLVGWTFGIYMAATEMLPHTSHDGIGFDNAFMMVWIIAAVAGWFLAARVLWKLLKGEPLKKQSD